MLFLKTNDVPKNFTSKTEMKKTYKDWECRMHRNKLNQGGKLWNAAERNQRRHTQGKTNVFKD